MGVKMKQNPRILFVANVDKEHILKFHIPTIKMLSENGWIVDVACAGTENIPFCNNRYTLHYERTPFSPKLFVGIKELKHILKNNHYDIIYCHTPVGGLAARLASISIRNKHTKVIYFSHGYHFFEGAPILNWLIYYPIEKILSYFTDSVITINKEDFEITKNKFKTCKAYFINGIGIDTEKFNFENRDYIRSKYRKELNIADDSLVLIYLAELIKNKNQYFLIRVIKYLIDKGFDNVVLVLAGIDHTDGDIEKYAKQLGVENNIRFLGWRNDVCNLYLMSDICTASSIREGFGLNIVEAMLCSVPVIAVKNRGHNSIITDTVNGFLVEQNDVSTFADRITELSHNNQLRELFIYNSQKNTHLYTTETILKELYCILSSHLGE